MATLETRLQQAQAESLAPIDLISTLLSDELACRSKRLLDRRQKQAQFCDNDKRLDNFDFQFNPKMNRALIFDLATAAWVGKREDSLFLGPPGSGKSHIAQAIGHIIIRKAIACSIARRMFSWKNWPTPRSTVSVRSTSSCGASPVSSALDRPARRDTGGAITNLPC